MLLSSPVRGRRRFRRGTADEDVLERLLLDTLVMSRRQRIQSIAQEVLVPSMPRSALLLLAMAVVATDVWSSLQKMTAGMFNFLVCL